LLIASSVSHTMSAGRGDPKVDERDKEHCDKRRLYSNQEIEDL
jgi:hypothetical protein